MNKKKESTLSYNITPKVLSIVLDKVSYVVARSETKYEEVLECLKNKDVKKLSLTLCKSTAISEYGKGVVTVKNGIVHYGEEQLHSIETVRILERIKLGLDVQPLLNFIEKLFQNTSKNSVDNFYNFIEIGNIAICDDGDVYLYKGCWKNELGEIWDAHTCNTIRNDVGEKPSRERRLIDDNSGNTCSASGLHISSKKFADTYGNVTMLVKLNPKDVVSISRDGREKIRVCAYEVVAEETRY